MRCKWNQRNSCHLFASRLIFFRVIIIIFQHAAPSGSSIPTAAAATPPAEGWAGPRQEVPLISMPFRTPLPSSALPELPRLDSWAALTPGNAGAVSWSRSAAPDRFQHHPRQAFLSFHCPLVVLRFQPFCRLLLWLQPRRTACTLDRAAARGCAGRTGLPNCCSASSDLKRGFPAEDTRVPLMQILPTPSLLFHSFQWEWAFWAQAAMSRLTWMWAVVWRWNPMGSFFAARAELLGWELWGCFEAGVLCRRGAAHRLLPAQALLSALGLYGKRCLQTYNSILPWFLISLITLRKWTVFVVMWLSFSYFPNALYLYLPYPSAT